MAQESSWSNLATWCPRTARAARELIDEVLGVGGRRADRRTLLSLFAVLAAVAVMASIALMWLFEATHLRHLTVYLGFKAIRWVLLGGALLAVAFWRGRALRFKLLADVHESALAERQAADPQPDQARR